MRFGHVKDFDTKIHPLAAAAVLVISAVLAACGSSSTTSSAAGSTSGAPAATTHTSAPAQSTGTPDACALITEQEATAALGTDPGPGKAQGTSGKSCQFSGPGGVFVGVSYGISNQTRAAYDASRAGLQAPYVQQGGTVQDLSGVGDAAFVAATGHGGACVVLKGSVMHTVTVVSPTVLPSPVDALTTLCRAMGGRI